VGGDADGFSVEHGVDIIRPAFKADTFRPRALSAHKTPVATVFLPQLE
jgi:hypothetical protein